MHQLEHAADSKRHELGNQLAREFMPPIEREDISTLSQQLDNVVDSVEDIIRKIYMFNIDEMRSEALEFSKLILDTCAVFYKLLQEFSNFKKSNTSSRLTRWKIRATSFIPIPFAAYLPIRCLLTPSWLGPSSSTPWKTPWMLARTPPILSTARSRKTPDDKLYHRGAKPSD